MKAIVRTFSFRLSVRYLIIGLIYIFASDLIVQFVDKDPGNVDVTWMQTIKGSIFVIITAILLFIVIRRHELRINSYIAKLHSQNNALTDHARITSHEIRKPVANLIGLIDLLNMDTHDKEMIYIRMKDSVSDIDGKLRSSIQIIEKQQLENED